MAKEQGENDTLAMSTHAITATHAILSGLCNSEAVRLTGCYIKPSSVPWLLLMRMSDLVTDFL